MNKHLTIILLLLATLSVGFVACDDEKQEYIRPQFGAMTVNPSPAHPGDSVDIANHTEAFLNKGVVILVKECDGTSSGRVRAIGSKCNPLYLQPEYTNSGEGTNRKFVWKQAQGDKFAIATYGGTMPALAPEPTTGSESGA